MQQWSFSQGQAIMLGGIIGVQAGIGTTLTRTGVAGAGGITTGSIGNMLRA